MDELVEAISMAISDEVFRFYMDDPKIGLDDVAHAALAAIAAHPRYELVELPEPTHGPDGEGQLSWHTGTSVISATPGGRVWEEDFDMEPHEAQENAAALLAAARQAELADAQAQTPTGVSAAKTAEEPK